MSWKYFSVVVVFFIVIFLVDFSVGKDLYETLGVNRGSSKQEIKRAYRALAKQWHPDKHADADKDKASAKYQEITHAYEILSDDQKRRTFDQFGEEGLKKQQQQGGGGFGWGDMFSGFGFNTNQRDTEKHGDSIYVELQVTLEDIYLGRTLTVSHRKQTLCPSCRGTGAKDPNDVQQCSACKGSGVRIVTQRLGPGFVTQTQTTCDKCGGKGRIIKAPCESCKGSKVAIGEDTVTIVVERGMVDGAEIKFEQEADQAPGVIPGDLVFRLQTLVHAKFTRRGNDLLYTSQITLLESLVGFTKTIKHLDGRTVTVTRDDVTKPGFTMVVQGEGMPIHEAGENGDLYVEFFVKFPRSLTQEQKEGVQKLFSQ